MNYLKSIRRILTKYFMSAIILGALWGAPLVILLVIEFR